jgi:hypothetical protein
MLEHANENTAFQAYLTQYKLQSLDVAIHAQVRYVTVWNILRNKPITAEHAALVRAGLQRQTGVAYTGPIVTHPL